MMMDDNDKDNDYNDYYPPGQSLDAQPEPASPGVAPPVRCGHPPLHCQVATWDYT